NFSIAEIASNLIPRINMRNIFPPIHNKPEELIPTFSTNTTRKPRRSMNSFLIFRKNIHEEIKRIGVGCNMRVISRIAGVLWRNASLDEKQFYEDLSQLCNDIHNQRYNSTIKHQAEIRKRPLACKYNPYEVITVSSQMMREPEPVIDLCPRPNSLQLFDQNPVNLFNLTEENLSHSYFTFRGDPQ
ncbi:10043_t:CDS:2, partial [Scutellospora calospora]